MNKQLSRYLAVLGTLASLAAFSPASQAQERSAAQAQHRSAASSQRQSVVQRMYPASKSPNQFGKWREASGPGYRGGTGRSPYCSTRNASTRVGGYGNWRNASGPGYRGGSGRNPYSRTDNANRTRGNFTPYAKP